MLLPNGVGSGSLGLKMARTWYLSPS